MRKTIVADSRLGDSESCLARINTMSYEDYERNRLGKSKSGAQ